MLQPGCRSANEQRATSFVYRGMIPSVTDAPIIRIRRLPHSEGLELPSYATAGAAGADLRAAVEVDLVLAPGARVAVPTGLILEIPVGWEGQVRPRSGLAFSTG